MSDHIKLRAEQEIERAWAAFCVAVGRARTDADVNGEPMMLAVAHAQRVSGLEAEIERLNGERAGDQQRLFHYEADIERLRALLRRYRNETPLGYQPHMIAGEVDRALEGK